MSIEEKALQFAIKAHEGQVRKNEKDKPKIFHPINVGQILKEYGFDENVVAAGYLHDVVEDTKYTFNDIKKEFGKDIESLVKGASEPDKRLDWKTRKQHTIETTKKLDIRHKVVICADKISNLEDTYLLFGKTGKVDFSVFNNKDFKDHQWYYTSVLESLKENKTDEQLIPMLERYDDLLQKVFYNGDINIYLRNVIFDDEPDMYREKEFLRHKKEELLKLKNLSKDMDPYVIEFTGTPRTGKTTLINNLEDFFKKGGFKTSVLEEFTTSKKYKQEIYPHLKDQYKNVINTEIPKYVLNQLIEEIEKRPDIIIADRSLLDRLIWADRLYNNKGFTDEEYELYKKIYIPKIKKYINLVIGTYTDSLTSVKRDYKANLALEERRFLNTKNVDEYNASLSNIERIANEENINFYRIDTTNKSQGDVAIEVANVVTDNIRKEYINRLTNEYKQK